MLRIRDWHIHFENNRTRELKKLEWVPIPNDLDGDGYTELVDHPNGAAHFGAWMAIVEIASKCDMRGTLSRRGARPHDAHSLARISRIPVEIFEEAIPRLIEIGWLEQVDEQGKALQQLTDTSQDAATIPQEVAEIPQQGALKGREGKEGKEGNGNGGRALPFDLEEGFSDLWQNYPQKGRTKIEDSKRMYVEVVNPDPHRIHGQIIESIQHGGKWASSDNWHRGFVCSLFEFLRNRRWLEDPEPYRAEDRQNGAALKSAREAAWERA